MRMASAWKPGCAQVACVAYVTLHWSARVKSMLVLHDEVKQLAVSSLDLAALQKLTRFIKVFHPKP